MNSTDLAKDPIIIDLRRSIDNMDISFLNLLAERMRVVDKIMRLKRSRKIDLNRSEARINDMRRLIEMSVDLKMESVFFRKILDLVFQDAMIRFDSPPADQSTPPICDGAELEVLRTTLFNLDKSLCLILAERFKVVKRIGSYKCRRGIPFLDRTRWRQVLDHKIATAKSIDISATLVRDIFTAIHEVALNIEERISDR